MRCEPAVIFRLLHLVTILQNTSSTANAVPLPPLGKAWFMRKMSHKPVGVDVLGDPFWMNINAASYYIVQTHIPVPLAFPSGEGGCDVGADG